MSGPCRPFPVVLRLWVDMATVYQPPDLPRLRGSDFVGREGLGGTQAPEFLTSSPGVLRNTNISSQLCLILE